MSPRKAKYNPYELCKDIAEASLPTSAIAEKHGISERQVQHIMAGESRPELKRIIDRLSRSRYREIQRAFRSRGRAAAQRLFQLIEGTLQIKRKGENGETTEDVEVPVPPSVIRHAIADLLKYSAIAEDNYDDEVVPTVIRTPLRMPLQPKNPVGEKTDSTAPRARENETENQKEKPV